MANATRVADQPRSTFVGSYAGTTAAQNINIGFKPSLMIVWNATDRTNAFLWMASDTAHLVNLSSTGAATQSSAIAQVDDGTTLGFSLPACDTVVNSNGKTYYFIAFHA